MDRRKFQGLSNIIRFNWPFYVLAIGSVTACLLTGFLVSGGRYISYALGISILIGGITGLSLIVSFYIYDLSGLYHLSWLPDLATGQIVNIHAGFDETSHLLAKKYPNCHLSVFDFYDPVKHREPSIARARKAYPAFPGTRTITTEKIPLEPDSADVICLLFAAHEIRLGPERELFFKRLKTSLKDSGKIIVAEHLRDRLNFMAYTVGFFHFLPKATWMSTFRAGGLQVRQHAKLTPFVTIYTLEKDGMES